jgi:hypothetical protein
MKDNAAVYSRILEHGDSIMQGYVASRRTTLRGRLTKTTDEYIDTLPISNEQGETLRSIIECHRFLVEDCLQHLENLSRTCVRAMRQRFSRLSLSEQQEVISVYQENEPFAIPENNLVVIQGGKHP